MPVSALLLIATVATYLLLLIPMVGGMILVLGGPLWSVATVNLAMIFMAWEAWTGRIKPVWVVVPVIYFGGYYAVWATEYWQAREAARQVIAQNASVRIPYVAGQTSLVWLGRSGSGAATSFLRQNYAIDQVFASNSRAGSQMHLWRVIGSEFCRSRRENTTTLYPLPPAREARCAVATPQEPGHDRLAVSRASRHERSQFLDVEHVLVTVRDMQARTYEVRGAAIWTRPYFPMPLLTVFDSSRLPLTFPRLMFTPVGIGSSASGWYDPFAGGTAGQRALHMADEALAVALGFAPIARQ
jgi:hypothetical protein